MCHFMCGVTTHQTTVGSLLETYINTVYVYGLYDRLMLNAVSVEFQPFNGCVF